MIRPKAVDDAGFTIEAEADGSYTVRGSRPERWVKQTNFDNDEAVGYLADRLARLGVEEKLAKAGAQAGDLVRIGERRVRLAADALRRRRLRPGQPGHRHPAGGQVDPRPRPPTGWPPARRAGCGPEDEVEGAPRPRRTT